MKQTDPFIAPDAIPETGEQPICLQNCNQSASQWRCSIALLLFSAPQPANCSSQECCMVLPRRAYFNAVNFSSNRNWLRWILTKAASPKLAGGGMSGCVWQISQITITVFCWSRCPKIFDSHAAVWAYSARCAWRSHAAGNSNSKGPTIPPHCWLMRQLLKVIYVRFEKYIIEFDSPPCSVMFCRKSHFTHVQPGMEDGFRWFLWYFRMQWLPAD